MSAGQVIFAIDGFEAAKLADIATEAGHTRGAVYAIFANKKDLFIEMLVAEIKWRMTAARQGPGERVRQGKSTEQLYRAFRTNYVQSLSDRQWNVLFIEYKLFALRHPEFRDKTGVMQRNAQQVIAGTLDEIFKSLKINPKPSALAAGCGLAALANNLGLEILTHNNLSKVDEEKMLYVFCNALCGKTSQDQV